MTALIVLQLFLHGLIAWGPAVTTIIDVEIAAAIIEGDVVVAVACDTPKPRILVEAVSARSI